MAKVWVYDYIDNRIEEMSLEKFRLLYNTSEIKFHETSIFFNKQDAEFHKEGQDNG